MPEPVVLRRGQVVQQRTCSDGGLWIVMQPETFEPSGPIGFLNLLGGVIQPKHPILQPRPHALDVEQCFDVRFSWPSKQYLRWPMRFQQPIHPRRVSAAHVKIASRNIKESDPTGLLLQVNGS